MTRRSVLTKEDIRKAKQLRRQGKSNREIAIIFNVGKTTIWENVYATKPRVRIYEKIVNDPRPACSECGIKLTRDVRVYHPNPVSIYQVPANFKIGERCLGCFLKSKGLTHMDLVDN